MLPKDLSKYFHHIGIPTTEEKPNERWGGESWDMHTSDVKGSRVKAQWHRFGPGCHQLPELVKTVPHVGFKVDDLHEVIKGETVLYGPAEPLPGYLIAFIDDHGVPIELVQTDLTDEEAMALVEARKKEREGE